MKFKAGDKIVVVRTTGRYGDYHYEGDTDDVPLKTEGVVQDFNSWDERVRVKLKNGRNWNFHPNEIKTYAPFKASLGKLPESYIFSLTSQVPGIVIDDRLYTVKPEPSDVKANYLEMNNSRYELIDSASVNSLEEISYSHNVDQFEKIEDKFLKGMVDEGKDALQKNTGDYAVVDFIVNQVFPYLSNEQDGQKVGSILGVGTKKKKKKTVKAENKKESELEKFINANIQKIENEKSNPVKKKAPLRRGNIKKQNKLNDLLGHAEIKIPKGQDYVPESVFSKAVEGKNVAMIEGNLYHLVKHKPRKGDTALNFKGKNYIFTSSNSLTDLRVKYDEELSKKVRIDALKNKLSEQKGLQKILESENDIAYLAGKKSHRVGNFGFMKAKYYDSTDYYVFMDVPEHVLKEPGRDRYYHFKKNRIAVKVKMRGGRSVDYSRAKMVDRMSHPFSSDTSKFASICLGSYSYSKLDRMKNGEAIAKLLVDTKNTLISGYIDSGTGPERDLDEYGHNRISLSEIKKKGLQITNVKLGNRRRRSRW